MRCLLPNMEVLSEAGPVAERARGGTPGQVYAFVPAHSGSAAGTVQEHLGRAWSEELGLAVLLTGLSASGSSPWRATQDRRRLEGIWGAFVQNEGKLNRLDVREVRTADVERVLKIAAHRYDVVCADLTGAHTEFAREVLGAAHSIFLVSDSDRASLEQIREKMDWLGSIQLAARCVLLLRRVPGGLRPDLAEDLAGAPVCGLAETAHQIARLAEWLAGTPASPGRRGLDPINGARLIPVVATTIATSHSVFCTDLTRTSNGHRVERTGSYY
jgi:hypothetical protein